MENFNQTSNSIEIIYDIDPETTTTIIRLLNFEDNPYVGHDLRYKPNSWLGTSGTVDERISWTN